MLWCGFISCWLAGQFNFFSCGKFSTFQGSLSEDFTAMGSVDPNISQFGYDVPSE
jgi:hypothetical protein